MNTLAKKNIIFVTNNYFPYSGGVVSSIEVLRTELERKGYSVFVITLDFLGKKHQDIPQVIRVNCPIKFRYKKNAMAIPWRAGKEVAQYVQLLNPAIIHVHHPFLLGNCAAKLARARNIPLVFTHHSQYEHYLHYIPLPKKIMKFFLERRMATFCSRVDAIIAPSKSVQTQLMDYEHKVRVIPSSISPLFFEQEPLVKKTKEKFELLTVSRFVKEKNIPFLLDVFSMLDQSKYVFTLVGFGAELPSLQEYAYQKLKLSPNVVTFLERPSKEKLIDLYRNADLFIFASQSETQGLVIAESMASGTPVIALQGPGQSDIIMNGINGFLVETKDQMREKIEFCFLHKNEFQQLRKNARRDAQHYKPEIMAKNIIDLYDEIIKGK